MRLPICRSDKVSHHNSSLSFEQLEPCHAPVASLCGGSCVSGIFMWRVMCEWRRYVEGHVRVASLCGGSCVSGVFMWRVMCEWHLYVEGHV